MSHEVTLAKYCEGKSGNAFDAGGNVRGSRGYAERAMRCGARFARALRNS